MQYLVTTAYTTGEFKERYHMDAEHLLIVLIISYFSRVQNYSSLIGKLLGELTILIDIKKETDSTVHLVQLHANEYLYLINGVVEIDLLWQCPLEKSHDLF